MVDRAIVSWILAALLVGAVASGWFGVSRAERQALEATGRLEVLRTAREEAETLAGEATRRLEAVMDSLDRIEAQAAEDRARAREAAAAASVAFRRAEQNARAVVRDSADALLIDSLVIAHDAEVAALRAENDALVRERDVLRARVAATDDALTQERLVGTRLRAELQAAIERGDAWRRASKPGLLDWVQRAALVYLAADKLIR